MDLDSSPPLGFVFFATAKSFYSNWFLYSQVDFVHINTVLSTSFQLLFEIIWQKSSFVTELVSDKQQTNEIAFLWPKKPCAKRRKYLEKNYVLISDKRLPFPFSHERATQMFSFLPPFFQLRSLTYNGNVGIPAFTSTVFASYTWNLHFSNPRLSCFLVQNSGRLSRAKEHMPISDRLPNRCSKRQMRLL